MTQWDMIVWTYAAIALIFGGVLALYRPKSPEGSVRFIAFTYIGGLTFLPAVAYDGVMPEVIVPTWFIGALIPSKHVVISKVWIAALAALAAGLRLDWRRIAAFRPGLIDMPIALFCLLPFAQAVLVNEVPAPSTFRTFLLLTGCWGLPWFLGRIYLNGLAARIAVADALIICTLLLLPVAVFEGTSLLRLHELLFGPHPFGRDGTVRALSFRPIAFFEHGNQYGIWLAAASFAAWWRARFCKPGENTGLRWLVAFVLIIMTLAAQSFGAIALLFMAIVWLECAPFLDRHRWSWRLALVGIVSFAIVLARQVYVGAKTGYEAPPLSQLTAMFGDMHRQTLVWRMDRALDSIAGIKGQLLFGHARWDWYSSGNFRPWDLTLMLVGQFGLVGLGLVTLTIVSATRLRHSDFAGIRGSTRHLALGLIGMAVIDALMNSYVFYPGLVMLGALASSSSSSQFSKSLREFRERPERDDEPRRDRDPSWLTDNAPAAIRPGKKM
jgi:hypothetical protein